jgi:hypothetical protein
VREGFGIVMVVPGGGRAPCHDDDIRAEVGQDHRGLLPDAAAGAGDQRDRAL